MSGLTTAFSAAPITWSNAISKTIPSVLNFSGSDSSGLAGIQVDLKTQSALGVHSATVITAVTAQNSQSVIAINPVARTQVQQQLDALQGIAFAAIKSGLLASLDQIELLAAAVQASGAPYVCDPVMRSSSGAQFSAPAVIYALKRRLLPVCELVTPNVPEAELLSGLKITSCADMELAGERIMALGARSVYIKGGHSPHGENADDGTVRDYFCSAGQNFWLSSPRVATPHARGTGCAFASAAAAALALGFAVENAVVIAKMAINQGLRNSYGLPTPDRQVCLKGTIQITAFPCQQRDLPCLTRSAQSELPRAAFMPCDDVPIGLYPVVDSVEWLTRLLALGITTVQLRIKNMSEHRLAHAIKRAVEMAKKAKCRLFINDHWMLALQFGAYGVHLGQEDLDGVDFVALQQSGLRLGISTHCHYEVARAHGIRPSYIACGPVYPTTSKEMPWVPHGVLGLSYWQKLLDYPLVAIGGITQARCAEVSQTGVSGVAVISAIVLAQYPEAAAMALQDCFRVNSTAIGDV